jgi:hypothetical protein
LWLLERIFGGRKTNADGGVAMKTAEDEAFEDIERRQGGFHAKRQAAMDKVNAEFDEEYIKYREAFPKGYTTQQVLPKDYTTQQRVPLVDIEYTLSVAEPAQEPVDIAKFVEGMEVSIDVSTGDHDSTNRLFGTVTLVQQNQGSKHGLILLVQEPAPNFKPAAQPAQEPVECLDCGSNNVGIPATYDSLVDSVKSQPAQEPVAWMSEENNCIFFDADKPNPMDYDFWTPLYTTPQKRPWVGLTDEEVDEQFQISTYLTEPIRRFTPERFARFIEANLKQKNNG